MSHRRDIQEKKKLRSLYKKTSNKMKGCYFDERKGRYIQCYFSGNNKYTKYLKRQSNKAIRRNKDLFVRSGYKRCFDYWWELY